MNVLRLYNAGLILSADYTDLCLPYTSNKLDKTMTLESALSICTQLLDNTPEAEFNRITLYGINNTSVWRDMVIPITQFILDFNKTQLSFQVENNFLNELQLKFCRDTNIFLNLVINSNDDIDYVKNILSYKPTTKIYYKINRNTISRIYDDYVKLSSYHCLNYDLDLDFFEDWTEEDLQVIQNQFVKIVDYIKAEFTNNEIPLVPDSFKRLLNRIIIQDYDIKNNSNTFDFITLINKQCGFSNETSHFINQDGLIFTCCLCNDTTPNSNFYCGYYDFNNNKFVQEKDEFDLFNGIYPDMLAINKQSTSYNCNDCRINSICAGNCYSINLIKNAAGNITDKLYCDYTIYLYDLLVVLIMDLDKEKNELFKDFLYGCSFKGYFRYDR